MISLVQPNQKTAFFENLLKTSLSNALRKCQNAEKQKNFFIVLIINASEWVAEQKVFFRRNQGRGVETKQKKMVS